MKTREIPFTKPHIPESTLLEIGKVLKSGWITTGQKAKEFEQEFAKFIFFTLNYINISIETF